MRVMKHLFARVLLIVLAVGLLSACGGKEERKAKYLERGKEFLAEKNYDKANIEFKNVLQIDPKTAEAYLYLGEIEEKKQNWLQSFGNYKKASELNPELITPRVHLAEFYLVQAGALRAKGDKEAELANVLGLAQEQVQEILARDPGNLDGLTLQATLWVNDGDVDKAADQLEKVIETDPGSQTAALLLANIYFQKGRLSDVEAVLKNAAAHSDETITLHQRLAEFYAAQGHNDEVEDVLRKIVTEHPDEVAYRVTLASFLSQTGQEDKAETVLRETIAADPKDVQRYLLLTEFLAAKRDKQTAIDQLKQVIEQNPEMWDLKQALVRLYLASGQTEEAESTLTAIINNQGTEPAGIKARVSLAQLLAAENPDSTQVRELVDQVLQQNPRDSDALLLKGKLAMRSGNFAEAIADFRSVLRDQPNSPEALQLLATAHAFNGEMALARDTLVRGIENHPRNASLRLGLAELLARSEEIDDALAQVQAVLDHEQHHEEALALKYELLMRKGDLAGMEDVARLMQTGNPDSEDGFIREARLRIAQKEYDAAIAIADKVLGKNAESVSALIMKSDALAAQEKFEAAIPVVERLQEVAPDSAVGFFRKGRLLQQQGETAAALAQYEKGLEREPDSVEMLTALVDLEIRHSGAEKAEQRLLGLLADNPDHRSANEFLGLIHMRNKEYVKAEKAFQAQIDASPENPLVYAQLAQNRLAQDDHAGAAQAYRKGLDAAPGNVRLLIGLAGVEEMRKNVDVAISLYEQVLGVKPDNAVSINNLAALLSDHRSDAESLDKAAELATLLEKTNQPAFRDTAGWVYYRKGNYDKAIEILEDVVEKAPRVSVFRYHLGMAYLQKGDKAAAREQLTKATEGDVVYAGVEEARTTLDTL